MKTIALDLIFVGFGNVGRRFARLLQEREGMLARSHGLTWRVVGIATRSHGIAFNPSGLDLTQALTLVEGGGSLAKLRGNLAIGARTTLSSALDLIEQATHAGDADRVQAVVETTVLDITRGQPAIDGCHDVEVPDVRLDVPGLPSVGAVLAGTIRLREGPRVGKRERAGAEAAGRAVLRLEDQRTGENADVGFREAEFAADHEFVGAEGEITHRVLR